jgi:PHP family Zn ribbon phosphoesterase
MKSYKADLHTHTVLSPCGDLEMSPVNIVDKAIEKGLDIIGVTDHNSALQCPTVRKVAEQKGLFVLCGAEVTTKEEVHCLAFFEKTEQLDAFSDFIYEHLADFPNDPDKFGYQAVVDENELILNQPEKLLISATDISIENLEKKVHKMGGLFIPAHIDRISNGIIGQLGFIPPDLKCDAVELSRFTTFPNFTAEYPQYQNYPFIQSSDAHYIDDIDSVHTRFYLEEPSFKEIHKALKQEDDRKTELTS